VPIGGSAMASASPGMRAEPERMPPPPSNDGSGHHASSSAGQALPKASDLAVPWQGGEEAAFGALAGDAGAHGPAFVSLGQVADVRIVGGPPMLRDEGGLLVGYVFVDVDSSQRDLGGYVAEAKQVVEAALQDGKLQMPRGSFLKWTGQYEELEKVTERMRIAIPLTLLLILLLLYLHFRNLAEVLIVLLSVPFALAGSVWLLWLLDYRMSTPVWVGLIALVGLAAQTGIVMIVYIDNAYERRKRAGKIRDLSDIVWAHMEGTVQRVRPKLMTVATMFAGLLPLLWATGSGAEIMKRVAAPMIGGLFTSALLTLEIIPVVYTYWRQEQLFWERLADLDRRRLGALRLWCWAHGAGWALLTLSGAAGFYIALPKSAQLAMAVVSGMVILSSAAGYLRHRVAARALVWPGDEVVTSLA